MPEIKYAGDVPLIPNVRPVIVVSGSDYDIGYQWYTLARAQDNQERHLSS